MRRTLTEQELRNLKMQIVQIQDDSYSQALNFGQGADIDKVKQLLIQIGEKRLRLEKPDLIPEYERLVGDKRLPFLVSNFAEKDSEEKEKMMRRLEADLKPLLYRILSSKFANEIKAIKDPTLFSQINTTCLSAHMILQSSIGDDNLKNERTYLMLNHYKTEVEGVFTFFINVLILALMLDGHQYYRNKKRIKLETMKDIRKETLANKLQFLSKMGYGYFTDSCNRALRNSVAHENYQIEDYGSFTYWHFGKKVVVSQQNLGNMISTIISACAALNSVMFKIMVLWIKESVDATLENFKSEKTSSHIITER